MGVYMINYDFGKILKERIVLANKNNFQCNAGRYPDFIFSDHKENAQDDTDDFNEIDPKILQTIANINNHDIAKAYNFLSDNFSKEMFLNVIVYRMLGSAKLQLPMTEYSTWNDYFAIKNLKVEQDSKCTPGVFLYKLDELGIPVNLFYSPYGIFLTFFRKQYEYGNIKPKAGDYVIDGGACIGDTALYFANAVGEHGKVFSFEFIPNNLRRFEENLNANPSLKPRIELVKAPLWKNSSQVLFTVENGAASFCVDKEPEVYNEKVQSISIDDLVKTNNIPKIDFIKMDIEGSEPEALLGAVETIKKYKPNLAICIYHDFSHFFIIPMIIKSILPEYNLYVDHHTIHLGETVLYASIEPAQKKDKLNNEKRELELADIVVIDSTLPNDSVWCKKNSDALEFSRQYDGFKYYGMFSMLPGEQAWFNNGYGMTEHEYGNKLQKYIKVYPDMQNYIRYLSPDKDYKFNLAFSYHLGETYTLLPFYKKYNIPFCFMLSADTSFGFENESSDAMIKEIVDSNLCKKIFVSHKKIGDYLTGKGICADNLIHFDPLRTLNLKPEDVKEKQLYKKDKQSFDICFTAFKYTESGLDLGYDLFIEVAKVLAKKYDDIYFHVIGAFNPDDANIAEIKDRISFRAGILTRFLPNFYAKMDINLSPNRPFKAFQGSFDEFPLDGHAIYCGVCSFNTDLLGLNTEYTDKEDIVLIKAEKDDIIKKIIHYYNNIDELYRISANGQKKAKQLYNSENCIANRIKVFNQVKNKS